MKVKSAKEALELSLPIWKELSETGQTCKPIELAWNYKWGCPCCEYVFNSLGKDTLLYNCKKLCPINWNWNDDDLSFQNRRRKLCHRSFWDWNYLHSVWSKKKAAEIIYDTIKKSLEEYDNEPNR